MNYCTKCQSIYSKPGTCNCYAPVQTLPYVPYTPTYIPWWQPYPYTPTITSWSVTTSGGTFEIPTGTHVWYKDGKWFDAAGNEIQGTYT